MGRRSAGPPGAPSGPPASAAPRDALTILDAALCQGTRHAAGSHDAPVADPHEEMDGSAQNRGGMTRTSWRRMKILAGVILALAAVGLSAALIASLGLTWVGNRCLESQDYEQAESWFTAAAVCWWWNGRALQGIGESLCGQDEYEEALAALERAQRVQRHPTPGLLLSLAEVHWGLDDADEARRCVDRAVRLGPTSLDDLMGVGLMWHRLEDYREAAEAYERALAKTEHSWRGRWMELHLRVFAMECYACSEKLDEASDEYRLAAALAGNYAPDTIDGRLYMTGAWVASVRGELAESRARLNAARGHRPDRDVELRLACLDLDEDELDSAEKRLEGMDAEAQWLDDYHWAWAELHAKREEWEQCEASLREMARVTDEDDADDAVTRGRVWLAAEREDWEAVERHLLEVDLENWWRDVGACRLRWRMAQARGEGAEAAKVAREWYGKHPQEVERYRRLEGYFKGKDKPELAEENAAIARALQAAKAELEDSEE